MTELARRLGLGAAIVLGLSSMLGAGVFVAFAPAAAASGNWLLAAVGLAAVVAFANATSSAQLAAVYPASGGTYVYGREELGPWWGYAAGWCFLIGKTASCAAMALTFGHYVVPAAPQLAAALAVVAVGVINYVGIQRTAIASAVLLSVVLVVLGVAVVNAWMSDGVQSANVMASSGVFMSDGVVASGAATLSSENAAGALATATAVDGPAGMAVGVAQGAAFIFFAFAGYARIATLAEEVREPKRTIPRAIVIALGLATVIYLLVAYTLLSRLGADQLATTTTPLADAVTPGLRPVVMAGAGIAALGALLGLMAGIGRTTLAMARENDVPTWLGAIHPRFRVPHRAEVILTIVVVAVVLAADVRSAIGFSSFAVLLYYFVANLAALRQRTGRRYPRFLQVIGLVGCAALAVMLPLTTVLIGAAVLVAGLALRAVRRPERHHRAASG